MNKAFSRDSARGFTLVEALVALLVLSIGMLGIAALQMTGLRANLGAGWRSQATYLSYDIIDRMRANRTVAINAAQYNVGFGAPGARANPRATADLQDWKTSLATLPGGDGSVAYDVPSGVVTVTVRWTEQKDREKSLNPGGASTDAILPISFVMQSRL